MYIFMNDTPFRSMNSKKEVQTWCVCDRASYMNMTRGTNLMQQLW